MNEQMKHRIITISREYGSGGREIGQSLAARLGFSFYDKNVAELSAVQSGLSADFILKSEDDVPGSLSYRSYLAGNNIPLPDRIFMAQSDVIRRLAVQGPCVIVGRCADYVLRDFPGCFHLFVHAPLEERVRRVMQRNGCTEAQAEELIRTTDRNRAAYHDHYAQGRWGYASNYRFSIDSSVGIDRTVDIILYILNSINESGL